MMFRVFVSYRNIPIQIEHEADRLIAATFSMFNRYVDGLATLTPTDNEVYAEMGKRLAEKGYVTPQPSLTNV